MMARPTFLQKVLRRPSKKYGSTSTTELAHPAPRDLHSTKGELLRIATELNRVSIDVPYHHREKSCASESIQIEETISAIALDSTRYAPTSTSEKAQVPRYDAEPEFKSPDQFQLEVTEEPEVFYTPDSSPASSSPAASRPQTPVHSPSPTPPKSASSSCASLGSANPKDDSVSMTSLPPSSPTALISMIPINNEPRRHKRISDNHKLTYTDEDWAKDVRWLVSPPNSSTSGKHKSKVSRRNTAPSSVSNAASRSASSLPSSISSRSAMKPYLDDVPKAEPPAPHGRKPKGHWHMNPKGTRAMVGMTVLLEVEEDVDPSESDLSANPAGVNRTMSHRRSQSLSYAPTHALGSSKPVRPSQPTPKLGRRRSSSFPSPFHTGTPSRFPSARLHSRATNVSSRTGTTRSISGASRPASSFSHITSSTTRSPYTSAPSNMLDVLAAHASSSRDADALPSSATRGFTGLVLPRAATSPAASGSMSSLATSRHWKGGRGTATEMLGAGLGFGDEIDLTRAGLAQTTMASIEIVRGIASGSVQRKESKSRRPLFGWLSKNNDEGKGKEKGKGRQIVTESPLGFTAYRKPPVYVGGNSVLVQVWAVGLDGVDAQLVGVHPSSKQQAPGTTDGLEEERSAAKDRKRHVPVGYIPGRSFVGRVLEVGWEVDEDTVKKGEWVIGLNSVLKCGALAEFILVDRHRIHRVPHPYMPNHPTLTLASLSEADEGGRRNSLVFPSVGEPKCLTVDELALLPLSGVSAHRAMRTLNHITCAFKSAKPDIATRRPSLDGTDENKDVDIVHPTRSGLAEKQLDLARPRVLILRGHDGPGSLALQMLVRAGWSVWVHVPVPFDLPGLLHEPDGDFRDEGEERTLEKRRVVLKRIEKRLREWGADEVLFVPIKSSFTSTLISSSAPAQRDFFTSLHSPHHSQSPSSTPSPNTSPSPFSRSSTSSQLSSPSLIQLESSSYDHLSSTHLTSHCTFPAPYSCTGLPLPPYNTEATSVTALLAYLTRAHLHFDAVIDTVGGREIWEAGRALLSLPVHDAALSRIEGQFTTLVGDAPNRVVSTTSDHFNAGVRALRIGKAKSTPHDDPAFPQSPIGPTRGKKNKKVKPRPVNYAWVNVVSDVDWEGADVQDSLGAVLAMAVEKGVRPAVGLADFPNTLEDGKGKMKAVFSGGEGETSRKVVSFENTPHIFVPRGGLEHGGTVVSRIVG